MPESRTVYEAGIRKKHISELLSKCGTKRLFPAIFAVLIFFQLPVLCGCEKEAAFAYNVQTIEFHKTDAVILAAGEEKSGGYIIAGVESNADFSEDDIIFVSENEEVARISAEKSAIGCYLFYKITAVSAGEALIYAKAAEGSAVSEKISVTVMPSEKSEIETEAETETGNEVTADTEDTEQILKIEYVSSPVSRSETAKASIKGKPDTEYSICVYYSSSKSRAKGLENKISDSDGRAFWEWKVGNATKAGTHKIVISGGGETIEVYFTTTE